jgi:hypothetical protein
LELERANDGVAAWLIVADCAAPTPAAPAAPVSTARTGSKLLKIALSYGMTEYELAKVFGISTETLDQWQHDHPEFSEALILGKGVADERVKRSLYHRAVGYNVNAEKIFYNRRTGKVVRVPYIKHVPPDVTAALSWMRNRDPQNWRENHHLNVTSDDSTAISIQEAQVELLAKLFGVKDD